MPIKEVGVDVRENYYPRVIVDLNKVRHNMKELVDRCEAQGIEVCGVIKGASADPQIAKCFAEAGCKWIATSRMDQFHELERQGCGLPFFLIRVPMMSELEDVVRTCDISMQSDLSVLKATAEEAARQDRVHSVVLMKDVGDLREGFWELDEMVEAAKFAEAHPNLHLYGTGVNIGCYGSVQATVPTMQMIVDATRACEEAIGRKLEHISGADSSALPRVFDGTMPKEINSIRLGFAMIYGGGDLEELYDTPCPFLEKGVWKVAAEVLECRDKASHPIGTLGVDAFGKRPVYEDRGIRKKALVGVGRIDVVALDEMIPVDEGIEVLGGSSDHVILDVTDYKGELKAGDILEFYIRYTGGVYATINPGMAIEYIGKK